MTNVILAILGTIIFDWISGFFLSRYRKRKLKKLHDDFILKIRRILVDKNKSRDERLREAKKLCMDTKGILATNVYFILGLFKYLNKD